MSLGDKNSKFFNTSLKTRRFHNTICRLEDDSGKSITGPDLKVFITDFYNNLFNYPKNPRSPIPSGLNFSSLSVEDVINLCKWVSPYEIEDVVLNCNPDKAPGPDGFNGHFFKGNWSVIKNDVTKAILSFFDNGKMLKKVNRTFITLIPKVENSVKVKDFHPISLCNCLFKIISKILVNRLSPLLPKLISENQFAFVKGRGLLEVVLLANDLFADLSRDDLMCLKLGISKA